MKYLAVAISLLADLNFAFAAPTCAELLNASKADAVVEEYLQLLAEVQNMPAGSEKGQTLTLLRVKRAELVRLYGEDAVRSLQTTRATFPSSSSASPGVPKVKMVPTKLIPVHPSRYQKFHEIGTRAPETLYSDSSHRQISTDTGRAIERPMNGVQWSDDEMIFVVPLDSRREAMAYDMTNGRHIGSPMRQGILSRDGKRYASIRAKELWVKDFAVAKYSVTPFEGIIADSVYFNDQSIGSWSMLPGGQWIFRTAELRSAHDQKVLTFVDDIPKPPEIMGGQVQLEEKQQELVIKINGKEFHRFKDLSDWKLSDDGAHVLVHLGDLSTRKAYVVDLQKPSISKEFLESDLKISPNGKWLYQELNNGSSYDVTYINVENGVSHNINSNAEIQFVGGSDFFLYLHPDGEFRMTSALDPQQATVWKTDTAANVGVSPSGRFLLIYDNDGTLTIMEHK